MLKLLSVIFSTALALEAMFTVSPDTVSTPSDLSITISFDESVGKSAGIIIKVPDATPLLQEFGFTQSSQNMPIKFNTGVMTDCSTGSSTIKISSCVASSNQLDIVMSSTSFILSGTSLDITVKGLVASNPSSLWYKQHSFEIVTQNHMA